MGQKWIQFPMVLVLYLKMASGADVRHVKEGETVEIHCKALDVFSTVMWFRDLDFSDMEFIASFDRYGAFKGKMALNAIFSVEKMKDHILILKSFSRVRDSGHYCCVCIQSNGLKFGQKTQLKGEEEVEVVTKPPPVIRVTPVPTPSPCVCNNKVGTHSTFCRPIILGPLAAGCGLLLLLLIITSLYCNHIRTRRCPHHYKKKPRAVRPGKHVMTN